MQALAPVLSPHGVLSLKPSDEAAALDPQRGARIVQAFVRGSGHGLLCLGADEVGTSLPPSLAFWREFGTRYVTALRALPGLDEAATKPAVDPPTEVELNRLAAAVSPMIGAEYLTPSVLADLWQRTDAAFDLAASKPVPAAAKLLDNDDVAALFGLDMAEAGDPAVADPAISKPSPRTTTPKKRKTSTPTTAKATKKGVPLHRPRS
jgi:hypothetical protein